MSLPDTAEYWASVKRRDLPNDMVYHDPNFDCKRPKRKFHEEAKFQEDVNCYKCLQEIKHTGTKLPRREEPLDISVLNEGQKNGYDALVKFLNDSTNSIFVLEGYAGTGKTFLIKTLIKYIRQEKKKWKLAATAPTNKAVKVLMQSAAIDDDGIEYMTVHKLLGLKEQITDKGEQKFEAGKLFGSRVGIEDFDVLVIDEVSMLNDDLFLGTEDYKGIYEYRKSVKIIMMGDPLQIPPVGKENCIPFDLNQTKYKFERFTLTEIMRQKSENPIIGCTFHIRENLKEYNPISEFGIENTELQTGVIRVNTGHVSGQQAVYELLNTYFNSDQFKADADYCKVIAWRNNTIAAMNKIIRGKIFGEGIDKIMLGEKLIAASPIFDKLNESIIFNNSDEFEVLEISLQTQIMPYKQIMNNKTMKYYHCLVEAWMPGKIKLKKRIDILHEESEADFHRITEEIKKYAIQARSKFAWKGYYEVLRHFADVGYNYSITAHKSQGSTYKNVFLLDDDITHNPKVIERNRIKYTACSRPTDRLFIISRS